MNHTKGTISSSYKTLLEKKYDIHFTKFEKSKHPNFTCFFAFNYPASSKGIQIEIHGHALPKQALNQAVSGFLLRLKDLHMERAIAWDKAQKAKAAALRHLREQLNKKQKGENK